MSAKTKDILLLIIGLIAMFVGYTILDPIITFVGKYLTVFVVMGIAGLWVYGLITERN